MSSTNLEVVFEGPAVKSGTIDARLLAESLAGYSEVFSRANAILNGSESEAAVLVQSNFESGSFITGLEFVQNLVAGAQRLIATHPVYDATTLAGIIGFIWKKREIVESVIELLKRFKHEKPTEIKKVDGNNVELTLGDNNKVIVNNNVFQLSRDPVIIEGLRRVTNPLRQAEIDRITIKHEGGEQVAIEKSDAGYFEAEPLQLQSDNSPMEGQRECVLIVSKLSFVEGTTWSFIESGATLTARIEDPEFWAKVHQTNLRFGEGDRLRVLLRWEVVQTRSKKLVPKNTILKVYEVLPRPVQLRLDDSKGQE